MAQDINIKTMPEHVAIIMDGNGRWAKERGLARIMGHNAGMSSLREIVRHSSDIGVKYLTVYAFSTENWKRPVEEVSGIFMLLVRYVASELEELDKNNVRIRLIGDISALPQEACEAASRAVEKTKNNTGLVFLIAINYGGRAEIVRAVNRALEIGEPVTEESFASLLYTSDVPDPDVIIRTAGEQRLSNFLTWQSAYSEFVYTDVFWPDFTPKEYDRCLEEYMSRDRRFGGIKQ